MRHRLTTFAPLVLVAAATAHAQRLAPSLPSILQQVDTQHSTLPASVSAGIGLGAAGFVVGGLAGYGNRHWHPRVE